MMENYNIDKEGFYGDFGGAFIPEMLHPNIEELQKTYIKITESNDFKKEFNKLLSDCLLYTSPSPRD